MYLLYHYYTRYHLTLHVVTALHAGFVIPAAMVVAVGYVDRENIMLAVAFLTVGVGFTGLSRTGYACNHVDIAPRFASRVLSINVKL